MELLHAIIAKDVKTTNHLLHSGKCKPYGDSSYKVSPIFACISSGYAEGPEEDAKRCEVLRLLVQYGADTNVRIGMTTAAIVAADRGFTGCLKLLIQRGADLDVKCQRQETALIVAVRRQWVDCVKHLADNMTPGGLNACDGKGTTALMWAAMSTGGKSQLCLQHLLEAGAKLDVTDCRGYTALMCALDAENGAAVNSLLEHGALVNIVTSDEVTPLTIAFDRGERDHKHILRLLRYGAEPTLSRRECDFLHYAIFKGDKTVVKTLIASGLPPLDVQNEPKTRLALYLPATIRHASPLMVALLFGELSIARYFMANRYFTRFDVSQQFWDNFIHLLEHQNVLFPSSVNQQSLKAQLMEIFEYLSTMQHSLSTLSLVVVRSALTKDLVFDDLMARPASQPAKPTFREKVSALTCLSQAEKRTLLSLAPASQICCRLWATIQPGVAAHTECKPCHCRACVGDDFHSMTFSPYVTFTSKT